MKTLIVYDSFFGNTKQIAQAISPEGFFVKESEGPLKEGELERAADWIKIAIKL